MTIELAQANITEGARIPRDALSGGAPVLPTTEAPVVLPPASPAPAPAVPAPTTSAPNTPSAGSTGDAPSVPPPVVSEEPAPAIPVIDGLGDFLLALNKDVALVLLAAGCFFLGVILAVLTPGREDGHGRATAVAAPMTFLLTAPLWFPLLSGNLIQTSIAPIDGILAYAIDGSIRGQMFAFGVVMVIGYHAAAVFQLIDRVFKGLLGFIASKAPKEPPSQPPSQPPANPPATGA